MADLVEQPTGTLYEADEHAWIERQIAALQNGDLAVLDSGNLIAYLTDMAARDRRELGSRLIVLYAHIPKLRIQPEMATRSWRLTTREQQREIRRLLKSLPSLRHEVYPDAVEAAFDQMGAWTGADPKAWSKPDLDVAGVLGFEAGDARL
nr:DUF29 domain-containing protein [uncultured Rhodopila sp.]